ncbi:Uncharacterised protein [uncultured archaeon]|nr:Uncharacterised protein [uncultured archaeon]
MEALISSKMKGEVAQVKEKKQRASGQERDGGAEGDGESLTYVCH